MWSGSTVLLQILSVNLFIIAELRTRCLLDCKILLCQQVSSSVSVLSQYIVTVDVVCLSVGRCQWQECVLVLGYHKVVWSRPTPQRVCHPVALSSTVSANVVILMMIIKYKKLTSLHYCIRATKSHIQNSRNHFTRTQSDRTTNWLPLQTMWRDPI